MYLKNYIVNRGAWGTGPIKKIVRKREKKEEIVLNMEFGANQKSENGRVNKEITSNPVDAVPVIAFC